MVLGSYQPKGILRGKDKLDISLAAQCSMEVVDGMIEERFIDESDTGKLKLHNWKKHQGYIYYSDERSERARHAAKVRHSSESLKKKACDQQPTSTAPSPDPAPTPDPSPRKKNSFIVPTIKEVDEYSKEKGHNIDAEAFWHHHNTRNWILE
jgi:hypothetical protein